MPPPPRPRHRLGAEANGIPRHVTQDDRTLGHVQKERIRRRDAKIIESMYENTIPGAAFDTLVAMNSTYCDSDTNTGQRASNFVRYAAYVEYRVATEVVNRLAWRQGLGKLQREEHLQSIRDKMYPEIMAELDPKLDVERKTGVPLVRPKRGNSRRSGNSMVVSGGQCPPGPEIENCGTNHGGICEQRQIAAPIATQQLAGSRCTMTHVPQVAEEEEMSVSSGSENSRAANQGSSRKSRSEDDVEEQARRLRKRIRIYEGKL
jgi:hypothetical protein